MMALSACSTTPPLPEVPTNIDLPELDPTPPVDFLQKCGNLPRITMSEGMWHSLSIDQQAQFLMDHIVLKWTPKYYECALTHNALVEWHKANDPE